MLPHKPQSQWADHEGMENSKPSLWTQVESLWEIRVTQLRALFEILIYNVNVKTFMIWLSMTEDDGDPEVNIEPENIQVGKNYIEVRTSEE